MKKIVHHLRNHSDENKRHILNVSIVVVCIIMVVLWFYSIGRSINNSEDKVKIKQDLQPFSALKDNLIGGYKSISE